MANLCCNWVGYPETITEDNSACSEYSLLVDSSFISTWYELKYSLLRQGVLLIGNSFQLLPKKGLELNDVV